MENSDPGQKVALFQKNCWIEIPKLGGTIGNRLIVSSFEGDRLYASRRYFDFQPFWRRPVVGVCSTKYTI